MDRLKDFVPEVALFVKNPLSGSQARFGGPIVDLCLAVRETQSLYAAAEKAGMAYSRAWRIVKEAEADLGFNLFDRSGCQGSELTPAGEKLLDAYLSVSEALDVEAQRLFKEAFRM